MFRTRASDSTRSRARADARTAGLETPFHRRCRRRPRSRPRLDERDEPVERRTVGEETSMTSTRSSGEILARDADGVVIAVRERVHDRRVRIVGDVAALGLANTDRAVEHEPGHGRDADAAGLIVTSLFTPQPSNSRRIPPPSPETASGPSTVQNRSTSGSRWILTRPRRECAAREAAYRSILRQSLRWFYRGTLAPGRAQLFFAKNPANRREWTVFVPDAVDLPVDVRYHLAPRGRKSTNSATGGEAYAPAGTHSARAATKYIFWQR